MASGHEPDGAREVGPGQHRRFGRVSDDYRWLRLSQLGWFDDGDLEAGCPQVCGDLPT